MAINRKELLRQTGAAAAGASLGAIIRGLFASESAARPGPEPVRAPVRNKTPAHDFRANESYAQSGEDLIVAFMASQLGIPKVSYLDVGANDPVQLSNTYFFYRRGHRGVLVEPNRLRCPYLRTVRPGDTVLEAGIAYSAAREADYHVMTFYSLNTFSKEEAEHQVKNGNGKVQIREVIKRPLLDINEVIEHHFHGAPAFLSIDTEGVDLAILQTIDFGRFRPPIVCVETLVSATRRSRPEILEFMAKQGYVVRGASFVNTIFIDSELLS